MSAWRKATTFCWASNVWRRGASSGQAILVLFCVFVLLSFVCVYRVVTDKSLPYCGQIGVFAECDIKSGTYIGEYCGEVFVCDGQSESL